jgi:hypothetical protein
LPAILLPVGAIIQPMRRHVAPLAALCVATLALDSARAAQSPAPPPLRPGLLHVLETDLGFLPADLDAFRSGSVVARILTTADNREVAIAGAMHVAVSLDYYVSRITNVGVPSVGVSPADGGRFGSPASAADVAAWSLAPGDLKSLDLCDARGCAMRVSDDALERLRKDAGPKASAAADAWSRGARDAITGYVAAYQARGAAGLPTYRNGSTSIVPGTDLPALRGRFAFLKDPYADLVRFLDRYPAERTDRAAERFFWSLDVVMATPVLTVAHLVAWPAPTAIADTVLITQDIYTSREVDALVEVTLLAADTTPGQPGVTVVTTSRSVSSGLLGLVGGAKRSVARSTARTALADYLTMIRTAFERDAKR